MVNDKLDFSKCQDEELIDFLSRLDRNRFPEKFIAVENEIRKRYKINESEVFTPDTIKNIYLSAKPKPPNNRGKYEYEKMIKGGWSAGLILGGLYLFKWILDLENNNVQHGSIPKIFGIIDVLLVLALTYGIFRKSRVCTLLLIIYFFYNQIMYIITFFPSSLRGIILLLILGYLLIRALIATIEYNKLLDIENKKAV